MIISRYLLPIIMACASICAYGQTTFQLEGRYQGTDANGREKTLLISNDIMCGGNKGLLLLGVNYEIVSMDERSIVVHIMPQDQNKRIQIEDDSTILCDWGGFALSGKFKKIESK